jgi:hypothetical protein
MLLPSILLIYIFAVQAIPQVTFPFNAQVPDVARVEQSYLFSLSPSTFSSVTGTLSYSIAGQPAWLGINSENGTIYGTPGAIDVGAPQFTITGSDATGSASMQATLVVSETLESQFSPDISSAFNDGWKQCGLTCAQYGPNTAFTLQMPYSNFNGPDSKFRYATLEDHTPLPGWMSFDQDKLTFTGVTPQITIASQSLSINLITSDIAGFAGITTPFTFVVSNHQLEFDNQWESMDISESPQINLANLRSQLLLDHIPIANQLYASAAIINSPSWITFDPHTITIQGRPPNGTTSTNITIIAHDIYGDSAFLEIQFKVGVADLFTGHNGIITAHAGKQFSYQFNDTDFARTGAIVSIDLGVASAWLQFNPSDFTISGTIPWYIEPRLIHANMTISSLDNTIHEYQDFDIQIGMISARTKSA